MDFSDITAAITATGALGVAAFGVTEALGKGIVWARSGGASFGLPYVGFEIVNAMMKPFGPALQTTYGDGYVDTIASQYRAGRSSGKAPDTIRQGVRLALPFMTEDAAAALIAKTWDMGDQRSRQLAKALQQSTPGATLDADAQAGIDLAGRFATALDVRVTAAFDRADERYQAIMRLVAGVAAITMAVAFSFMRDSSNASHTPLWVAFLIGLAAVPLAPIAKDVTTSLQNALTAFKSVPTLKL